MLNGLLSMLDKIEYDIDNQHVTKYVFFSY